MQAYRENVSNISKGLVKSIKDLASLMDLAATDPGAEAALASELDLLGTQYDELAALKAPKEAETVQALFVQAAQEYHVGQGKMKRALPTHDAALMGEGLQDVLQAGRMLTTAGQILNGD